MSRSPEKCRNSRLQCFYIKLLFQKISCHLIEKTDDVDSSRGGSRDGRIGLTHSSSSVVFSYFCFFLSSEVDTVLFYFVFHYFSQRAEGAIAQLLSNPGQFTRIRTQCSSTLGGSGPAE